MWMVRSKVAPASVGSWLQRARAASQSAPLGGELATVEVLESGVVGGDEARARAAFDRHVADGHAGFHVEGADGRTGVFENCAGAAADADFGDEGENDVLGGDAVAEHTVDLDFKGFGWALKEALRREDVLNFGSADAECEGSESAVGGRVGIAADHGHTGLREAQFRADNVDDALVVGVHAVAGDAEFDAVGFELGDLFGGDGIEDGQGPVGRRNGVVRGGDGEVWATDFEAAGAKAGEGLRAGDFVDEVEIDIEQGGCAGLFVDFMVVPNFLA